MARKRLMFYSPPQGPLPWPSGPCGQVCTGCTLCGRGLGNGGGLVLCVECGEAIRDACSPMGILLRESFAAAKRRRAAAPEDAGASLGDTLVVRESHDNPILLLHHPEAE